MSEFDKTFTSLSFFIESPDYFEGGTFHTEMNDVEFNKKTLNILQSQLKQIRPFKEYEVFEKEHTVYGSDNKTFYLVSKAQIIEGAIEIETKKSNNFCLGVWQRNEKENKGLMRDFFINYLSELYTSIVTGKIANKTGMQFWKKILDYFTTNNLKVTIFSGPNKPEQPYEPLNFEDYWTHVKQDKRTIPTFVDGSDKLFKFYFV